MSINDLLFGVKKSIFVSDRNSTEAHCYLIKIDQSYLDLLPSLASRISLEEFNRSQGLLNNQKKYEFIYSRIVLREILSAYLGPKIEIKLDINGKPYVPDSRLNFNISHSNEWLLIGIAHNCSIGVDIEKMIEIPEQKFIEHHFLDEFYANRLFDVMHHYSNDLLSFYSRWTAAEAFYKATGDGIASQNLSKSNSKKTALSLFQKDLRNSYFMSALAMSGNSEFKCVIIDATNNKLI